MSAAGRTLEEELVPFALPTGGRGLAILPVIPEDAPYPVREGIARRRITATTGTCPCGATVDYRAAMLDGGAQVAEAVHEDRCPASTTKLAKAIRRWSR